MLSFPLRASTCPLFVTATPSNAVVPDAPGDAIKRPRFRNCAGETQHDWPWTVKGPEAVRVPVLIHFADPLRRTSPGPLAAVSPAVVRFPPVALPASVLGSGP